MWGQIATAVGQGAIGVVSGINQRGRIKEAGTVLQQQAEREAIRADERAIEFNSYLDPAYQHARDTTLDVYNRGADYMEDVARGASDTVINRAERAGGEVVQAGRDANAYLDPYATTGTQANTDLYTMSQQKAPTAADLEFDPGYQFRLAEGSKALERSAAARGGLLGGGTLRALTRYSQGEASQEYAAAFDRFMKQQQERRATLSDVAGRGLTAGTSAGQNLIDTSKAAGVFGTRGTEIGTGYTTRASELSTDLRATAAAREGDLGIAQTQSGVNNFKEGDRIARGYRDQAADVRADSMVASNNAFWQGIQSGMSGVDKGISLWDMSRAPSPASTPATTDWTTYRLPPIDYRIDRYPR